jgi:hypothetical protein
VTLQGIKPGDLIEVDDGKPYVAKVLEHPARQRVRCQPITFPSAPREARARDVIAHYRRSKRR